MNSTIKETALDVIKILALWLIAALSMALAALIIPGIYFSATETMPRWVVVFVSVFLLSVANFLIRPVVVLFARPLGWIVILFIGFLLDAAAIYFTAWILPGFIAGIFPSVLAGIVIALVSSILTGILDINEAGSWYQNRIRRIALRRPYEDVTTDRGLMIVEIDGLSYWHLRRAIDDGLMPTLKAMIEENGYKLSRIDCGLPSMTSSCQAGIMFGDNYDIPAYRWYDKSKQKLYVSASDAPELNERYTHGDGLVRGGTSILNMFNGDARTSLFTMANVFSGDEQDIKDRSEDISLLVLNPFFLARATALFLVDLVRELWEALRQKARGVQPRLNRLKEYYPFVRAAVCGLMRDIGVNLSILNMMRGAPVIYMLYLGYDEVAHHSGPWTDDAFGDLGRLDRSLNRIRKSIGGNMPRPYEFIVLSDHGQSFGATFKQRYGLTIRELIEQNLPAGTTVSQSIGGDQGGAGLRGVASDLGSFRSSYRARPFDRAVVRQGQKLAGHGADHSGLAVDIEDTSVTACGSGNACQVYFDLFPRKIGLSELNAAYPGMVDALVRHEGIGMVLGYEDDGSVVVLGKGGRRNLSTGEVTGDDPVAPYARESGPGAATIEKRIWQLRRVMEFPSAGDLWVISTFYPDGSVAALEELVGNHGGLGGEQTDAFIFHPPDMTVPDTRDSTDVFPILNSRRS